MELRERVARAIYEAERIVLGEGCSSPFKVAIVRYLAAADAAIAEVREATPPLAEWDSRAAAWRPVAAPQRPVQGSAPVPASAGAPEPAEGSTGTPRAAGWDAGAAMDEIAAQLSAAYGLDAGTMAGKAFAALLRAGFVVVPKGDLHALTAQCRRLFRRGMAGGHVTNSDMSCIVAGLERFDAAAAEGR